MRACAVVSFLCDERSWPDSTLVGHSWSASVTMGHGRGEREKRGHKNERVSSGDVVCARMNVKRRARVCVVDGRSKKEAQEPSTIARRDRASRSDLRARAGRRRRRRCRRRLGRHASRRGDARGFTNPLRYVHFIVVPRPLIAHPSLRRSRCLPLPPAGSTRERRAACRRAIIVLLWSTNASCSRCDRVAASSPSSTTTRSDRGECTATSCLTTFRRVPPRALRCPFEALQCDASTWQHAVRRGFRATTSGAKARIFIRT